LTARILKYIHNTLYYWHFASQHLQFFLSQITAIENSRNSYLMLHAFNIARFI